MQRLGDLFLQSLGPSQKFMDGSSSLASGFHASYLQTDIGWPARYRNLTGARFQWSNGGSACLPAAQGSLPLALAPPNMEVELW